MDIYICAEHWTSGVKQNMQDIYSPCNLEVVIYFSPQFTTGLEATIVDKNNETNDKF